MSIATWKKEFFGPMSKAVKSDKTALEHGIRKWTGLLPSNLKKHEIERIEGEGSITDGSHSFFVGDSECALCVRHSECENCPIAPCWGWDNLETPWAKWNTTGNPRPMLSRLKKALKEITNGKT